jgi:hypothetical protein
MKKTGIAFMIAGNLLHMCSGIKMKITQKPIEDDDSEMIMEEVREISLPRWLSTSFILAGAMIYLAAWSK